MGFKLGLFLKVSICVVLVVVTTNLVSSKRVYSESEDPDPQYNQRRNKVRSPDVEPSNKPKRQPSRNDLIKEQRFRKRPDECKQQETNLFDESQKTDADFLSSEKGNEIKFEQAIEHTDRKTLLEMYDYAKGLKDLINRVEETAKKCGCKVIYEPILDSKKKIDHGLNAVSNKLHYGSVHVNK